MRAQASAIYLLFVNMIGIGLAQFLTAALTQYVFEDNLAVGKSSAIVTGGAAIIAAALFVWGLPHFRAAVNNVAMDRAAAKASVTAASTGA